MHTGGGPYTFYQLILSLTWVFFCTLMSFCWYLQAQFKSTSMAIMATFFSLTTPVGIAVGIGISSIYNENSPTARVVEGVFNAASAGILIYMALVDLLAADFMSPRMQSNLRIQLGANVSLLLGAGCMSFLAKWAWNSQSYTSTSLCFFPSSSFLRSLRCIFLLDLEAAKINDPLFHIRRHCFFN